LIEPQAAQLILVFCLASALARTSLSMTTHTCGRDVKAVCVNFELKMRARDYFGHNMPMILIVKAVEDTDSIAGLDAARWCCVLASN
jgi:hypothetical protein